LRGAVLRYSTNCPRGGNAGRGIERSTPMKDTEETPSFKPETIGRVLLVDHDSEIRRAYRRALGAAGFEVEDVPDGRTAVESLTAGTFDLVVSEIAMPDIDGVALLRQARERDRELPVVLIAANPNIESAARAVELGALRYLIKPVDLDELRRVAEQACRTRRLARLRREAVQLLEQPAQGPQEGLNALATHFDSALQSLSMAYQPIVRWSRKRVFAYEALVRPQEPALPNPMALLAAAERLGRLQELGQVLRTRVADTIAAAPEVPWVFVNLHARDLLDESLYDAKAALSRIARRVFLEITERASLEDVTDLSERVRKLRRLGFRIAVDDLGAGYSGLNSFAQLEPDMVKLDMSLVRGVHRDSTKRRLVKSMTDLCNEMGILVVCEGVETREERDVLVEQGCDLLQGYLFAKPGPPFPAVAELS